MTDPALHLRPRERQVLLLLGKGLSTAQIAATLCLSYKTVKSHVFNATAAHQCGRVRLVVLVALEEYRAAHEQVVESP